MLDFPRFRRTLDPGDIRKRLQDCNDYESTRRGSRYACAHTPRCPAADATDRDAAHVISAHPEQGWSLLCNGVVVFEDFGELLPDGQSFGARRAKRC